MDIVLPDQFFDRHAPAEVLRFSARGSRRTSGSGDPVCRDLVDALEQAAGADLKGVDVHRGGTYICMEGPAFSTRAESECIARGNVGHRND